MAVGGLEPFTTAVGDAGATVRLVWSAPFGSSWAGPFVLSGDYPALTVDPGGANARAFACDPLAPPTIDGGKLAWAFRLEVIDAPAQTPEAHIIHAGEAVRLSIDAGAVEDSTLDTTGGATDAQITNGAGRPFPSRGRDFRGRGFRGRPGAWG